MSPFLEMTLFLKKETSHLFTCNKAGTHAMCESTVLFLIHKGLASTGPIIHLTCPDSTTAVLTGALGPSNKYISAALSVFLWPLAARFIPPSQQ